MYFCKVIHCAMSGVGLEQPRTQALYVLIIQLYQRSVNKVASARGCLRRF